MDPIRALLSFGFLASYVVRRARRRPRQDEESLEHILYGEEEREEA